MGTTDTRYDVSFGDVRDAQIVIGDHTTVVTPDGVKVVRIAGDGRPKLRPAPPRALPARVRPLTGRDGELELARSAAPGWPLQIFGLEGNGKTSVLKHAALAAAGSGPVVYLVARRRSVDDVQAVLFRSFWEAEEGFVPAPDEMPAYLADREATLVVDDLALDRDDLEVLLDTAPRCSFVLAGPTRTLWGRGAARELSGLGAGDSIALLERELGRPLAGAERAAAAALAAACGGRPQSLIELAATALARHASLERLVTGPQPGAAELLSVPQQRVLGALEAAAGAALGVPQVSAFSGVGDAAPVLDELERSGWVKSQSPRYRLARPIPEGIEGLPSAALARQLAGWARSAATSPAAVAAESEAIEALLERSIGEGRHDVVVDLVRATESKLATSGLLGCWERVLTAGLSAARAGGAPWAASEAFMLHQLGSRAIGARGHGAAEFLAAALEIRESLGDARGAELTQRNIALMPGGGRGGGHGQTWTWRGASLLGGLGLVGVVAAAGALLSSGEPERSGTAEGLPARTRLPAPGGLPVPTLPPGGRPAVAVVMPAEGGRYRQGDPLRAVYTCRAARGARLVGCDAVLSGIGPVASGSLLASAKGAYKLVVTARDDGGSVAREVVRYTVVGGRRRLGPLVTIAVPSSGLTYRRNDMATADFTCAPRPGADVVLCDGTERPGEPIDVTYGSHEFTVRALSSDGGETSVTVSYFGGEQPRQGPTGATGPRAPAPAPPRRCVPDGGSGPTGATGPSGPRAPGRKRRRRCRHKPPAGSSTSDGGAPSLQNALTMPARRGTVKR
jgi:hypothetical protein